MVSSRYTVLILALMLGLTVIYLNYSHTSGCNQADGVEDMKMYVDALNKRLLEAESQVTSYNICVLFMYYVLFTLLFMFL